MFPASAHEVDMAWHWQVANAPHETRKGSQYCHVQRTVVAALDEPLA